MKIYEWNIGMAATIPSNQGYGFNGWIIDEIIKDEPDCIVLTEFVVSRGIDYAISTLEEKGYHWFISSSTKSNGILIALQKSKFDFRDTFCYKGSTDTVITSDMLLGIDLPNFYEIQVKRTKNYYQ
jgi:exonuclease III